ncbi:MAG: GntR family transcriptional regulator [Chloroflexi bacterium]|nr:GntR family transcriptional regulator [Chloroflexota bacterium]MCL5075071.1 GntR family transcriptional regulator [Chloroflexota bacterium]
MAEIVSEESPLPLYYQVREIIRQQIEKGDLLPGARLETEQELTTRFGVSRTTVRQAINDLVKDGLLYRKRGKGTFIRQPRIEQELSGLTGFVEDMVALGFQPTARVIGIETVPATKGVAEQLHLSLGDEVVRIERVRLANGQPVSLDVTYIPPRLGRQIAEDDLTAHPIFSLLEDKYGILLGEADYCIEASAADKHTAEVLGVPVGAPILLIQRTVFAVDSSVLEYEELHYRGDRIRYAMRLKRKRPATVLDFDSPNLLSRPS